MPGSFLSQGASASSTRSARKYPRPQIARVDYRPSHRPATSDRRPPRRPKVRSFDSAATSVLVPGALFFPARGSVCRPTRSNRPLTPRPRRLRPLVRRSLAEAADPPANRKPAGPPHPRRRVHGGRSHHHRRTWRRVFFTNLLDWNGTNLKLRACNPRHAFRHTLGIRTVRRATAGVCYRCSSAPS